MRVDADPSSNTAIQTLLDLGVQEPVAHFYFDSNQHDLLTTEALLRSYIKQFLRHLYKIKKKPSVQVAVAIRRMFGSRTYHFDHTELMRVLLKPLIQQFKGSFLVVDGLDMCSPQECKVALGCFSSLIQNTSAKVIVCGRDELEVTRRLPKTVRIQVTHAQTADDVRLFVEKYLEERSTYDGPISDDASTNARIKDTLIEQAGEMYVHG
jgi:hypothetical protein